VVGVGRAPAAGGDDRPLLVALIRDGEVVGDEPLSAARDRHRVAVAELPPEASQLSRGEPVIPTLVEPGAPA
jgi:nicotinate phosphoribosyltransferase